MPDQSHQPHTLPAVVAAAARQHAGRVAIADGGVEVTYEQLDAARIASARAFVAAGLQPGERVAIWAPNISEWILAALGAQTVGGVLVPLNTRLKGAEASYILNASGARLLFTVGDFLGVSYPGLLRGHALPDLERIVLLRGETADALSWEAFLAAGAGVT
ncbi:MAG: AMP-binding protein, partial [Halioglobus sp.]